METKKSRPPKEVGLAIALANVLEAYRRDVEELTDGVVTKPTSEAFDRAERALKARGREVNAGAGAPRSFGR